MDKLDKYIGQIYGKLTVIKIDRERMQLEKSIKGKSNTYVIAMCSCNDNIASYNINKLKRKETNSCGCYKLKKIIESKKKYNEFDIVSYDYGILFIDDKEFYFDLEDYDKIKNMWWHINSYGYATHTITKSRKSSQITLHRYIMQPKENEYIDHINRNIKDNRKQNLRICTHQENDMNNNLYKSNTSGIIGVSWDNSRNKWQSRISINYQTIYLGRFNSIDEAIKIRLEAENRYFKEYAPQKHLFERYGVI